MVFIGAVHDFSALVASVRHRARSVAEIVKENLGPRAWLAMLVFIWIALVYLIIAFADITAATFVGKTQELEGLRVQPRRRGRGRLHDVPHPRGRDGARAAQVGPAALAHDDPLRAGDAQGGVARDADLHGPPVLADDLGRHHHGVLLRRLGPPDLDAPAAARISRRVRPGHLALAIGLVGILFGGFDVRQPIVTAAPSVGLAGSMFPFLFVTIACGACSGFHGLVCSGTTSKRIAEGDCKPVGYGGMLLEGLVAVIALATIMIVAPEVSKGAAPGRVYGDGLARFLTVIIGQGAFLFARPSGRWPSRRSSSTPRRRDPSAA